MFRNTFPESLPPQEKDALVSMAALCRGDILTMTTLAASGHPGGSMSSIDILLTIYKYAHISPETRLAADRDRIIVSIGHISPAVYACLGRNGFFDIEEAVAYFRLAGSIFEGHIERAVPGVEWTTGNLGQGLSAGCGIAMANKTNGIDSHVFVLMGDGEQQKGQIAEARRFAAKYNLSNLIAIVDHNGLQISGKTVSVMPVNIAAEYEAAGWNVLHMDGHDFDSISGTFAEACRADKPSLIVADTVMGKGVSFIEHKHSYHGSALTVADYPAAMKELGLSGNLEKYRSLRKSFTYKPEAHQVPVPEVKAAKTEGYYYAADASTDCRSASGRAMKEFVAASHNGGSTPALVFDCDLAGSIKTAEIEKNHPAGFVQCGISEHNACAAAGASSLAGVIPFFTGFAMFSVDEVYNQLRMNDINGTNLKVISTHAGVDVGEDGRTHQCVDYLGLMRNLYHFQVVAPCDPNQTDHAVRYAAQVRGNVHVVMGRSKVPVIVDENGDPMFGKDYRFEYGRIDEVRADKMPLYAGKTLKWSGAAIFSYGVMLHRALQIRDMLYERGIIISVYNVSTPLYLNSESIKILAGKSQIFVLEDHNPHTGLCVTLREVIMDNHIHCKVTGFGVESYAYSGTPEDVFRLIGLSPEVLADRIMALI